MAAVKRGEPKAEIARLFYKLYPHKVNCVGRTSRPEKLPFSALAFAGSSFLEPLHCLMADDNFDDLNPDVNRHEWQKYHVQGLNAAAKCTKWMLKNASASRALRLDLEEQNRRLMQTNGDRQKISAVFKRIAELLQAQSDEIDSESLELRQYTAEMMEGYNGLMNHHIASRDTGIAEEIRLSLTNLVPSVIAFRDNAIKNQAIFAGFEDLQQDLTNSSEAIVQAYQKTLDAADEMLAFADVMLQKINRAAE